MERKFAQVVLIAASAISVNAYAVAPGFYMGLMTGPATNSGSPQEAIVANPPPATTLVTPRSKQWGTRIYIGDKFNYWSGIELGLNYFSNINFDDKGVDTCGGLSARVLTFDLLGRFSLPFRDVFELYVKGGAAYAYTTTSGALNPGFADAKHPCGQSQRVGAFRPAASIGAAYNLTQNVVLDLSANRTMVGGVPGNVDFYALGISYHFVNIYCGQFLCDD